MSQFEPHREWLMTLVGEESAYVVIFLYAHVYF